MTTSKFKFFCILICNPLVRIASRISFRNGRPYRCSFDSLKHLLGDLKPGMVILTRTDYNFGNLFIHGYWTHSGLMISRDEMIEAVGRGVRKTTLENFFAKVDDFAVFNPLSADKEVTRTACEFAERAVGMQYNYTFRRKRRSFYCSELIYLSFEKGLRKCRGTLEYTEFGRPYWEKRMIITPDWLVTSPLNWARTSAALVPSGTDPGPAEDMPLAGRARKLFYMKPALFHRPGYGSL